jgi:ABC-type branched-subunit amino acid transport system permease subunit
MTMQDARTDLTNPARDRLRVDGTNRPEAVIVVLLLAIAIGAPFFVPLNVTNDLGQALCLGLFGIGFNLIFRYSGLLSFGHAAFFGFAAYSAAKLLQSYPAIPLPLLLLVTGFSTALLGLAIGHVCVRRTGAYFSMSTLAIAAFVYSVAFKWNAMTGGTDGLGGFMPSQLVLFPGYAVESTNISRMYFVVLFVSVFLIAGSWALMELTPFGNAVKAVKQNEERAAFLGYHTFAVKLSNFAIGAVVAGLAGALWAIDTAFVATDSIDLKLSTTVIILTFLGGSNWFLGPILGSVFYITMSDWLSGQTAYWQIWIGLLFMVVVLLFPLGLSGMATLAYRRHHPRGQPL